MRDVEKRFIVLVSEEEDRLDFERLQREVAGDLMGFADLLQLRFAGRGNTNLRPPRGLIDRTARGKTAAGNGSFEIKHTPLTCLDAPGRPGSLPALFFGQRRPEDMGVGVTGSVRNAVGKTDLHDLAQVHHRHLMADEFYHPKIVGDEEVGESESPLKVQEQVYNLRLDGDVKGTRGLVGDNKLGSNGKHARHANPPLFAARELVGKIGKLALFKVHLLEQLVDALLHFGIADWVMDGDRFGENIADAHLGIEGCVQVLENHLHLAPKLPEFMGRNAGDILSAEDDLTGGRFFKPQDRPADGRLAAAGFADQSHRLIFLEVKAYPVHRRDERLLVLEGGKEAFPIGKMLLEVSDLENRLRHKNLLSKCCDQAPKQTWRGR